MPVDSFKYLPRLIATLYQMSDQNAEHPIPWTPMVRPLSDCKFGLVTSAGLFHKPTSLPFDLERERAEPTWGDPSYRIIPTDLRKDEVGASHLHINTADVLADINIMLPIDRFEELAAEGHIGGQACRAISFMGYQGFPPDTTAWQQSLGPEVSRIFEEEGVDCVLLTPA